MKNSHKALQAIEVLGGGDFGLDMESLLHKKEKVDPRLKTAAQMITDIYMMAHAEVSGCHHPDWENKKYEILKVAAENEIVAPQTKK
jgi:pterin-4a-carbinolamine dehydratase